jgi:hypothetical protein
MTPRTAISLTLPAALFLTACDPVRENPGPPNGAAYIAPPPEPRRNPHPSPEVHRWLAASDSVRQQLATLRTELSGLQQFHVENHFDNFLTLDPATLDPAQLCYLDHFLDRGYFRIEREILAQLLESRRTRSAAPPAASTPADIAARLQAALQRDETLLIDLESAIARYKAPGDEPFQIPAVLSESDLAALRAKVTANLTAERQKIAELDGKITALGAAP